MPEQDLLAIECLRVVNTNTIINCDTIEEYLAKVARNAADLHLKYSQMILQNLTILNKK